MKNYLDCVRLFRRVSCFVYGSNSQRQRNGGVYWRTCNKICKGYFSCANCYSFHRISSDITNDYFVLSSRSDEQLGMVSWNAKCAPYSNVISALVSSKTTKLASWYSSLVVLVVYPWTNIVLVTIFVQGLSKNIFKCTVRFAWFLMVSGTCSMAVVISRWSPSYGNLMGNAVGRNYCQIENSWWGKCIDVLGFVVNLSAKYDIQCWEKANSYCPLEWFERTWFRWAWIMKIMVILQYVTHVYSQ